MHNVFFERYASSLSHSLTRAGQHRSGTSHGLTIGAIVGITFGSLVCLALIVVAGAQLYICVLVYMQFPCIRSTGTAAPRSPESRSTGGACYIW